MNGVRQDVDVIVIGGGPGGLALGVALSRRGLSAVILEAASKVPITSRGEFLQPNGIRVLDHLGILATLRAQDVWVGHRIRVYARGGRLLADFDYGVLEPPHNYMLIHRPHLLRQALLSALGSTEILWGTRCDRLERVDGTWRVKVTGFYGERTLRARVVVGADGAQSWVRHALGIRATVRPYKDAYILNVVPRPPKFPGGARQYQGNGSLLGILPVSSTELYVYWYVPANQLDRIRASGIEPFRKRLIAVAPDIGPELELPPPDTWLYLRSVKVTCNTWVGEGAALIGDAVHALNPNTGQGTNQALEDAAVLAEVLAEGVESGRLRAQDLKAYEQVRRPAAEFMQQIGDERAFLWTSANPLVSWMQERVTRNLNTHAEILRKVVAQSAGILCEPLSVAERLRLLT